MLFFKTHTVAPVLLSHASQNIDRFSRKKEGKNNHGNIRGTVGLGKPKREKEPPTVPGIDAVNLLLSKWI